MAAPKRPRVLIVEDHEPCARLLEITLTRAEYATVTAASIDEALFALAKEDFDALVCDLLLPDGNGCEIAKVIREKDDKLLTIAISGLLSATCQSEALASGFDMFLSKPFRPQVLTDLLASGLVEKARNLQ